MRLCVFQTTYQQERKVNVLQRTILNTHELHRRWLHPSDSRVSYPLGARPRSEMQKKPYLHNASRERSHQILTEHAGLISPWGWMCTLLGPTGRILDALFAHPCGSYPNSRPNRWSFNSRPYMTTRPQKIFIRGATERTGTGRGEQRSWNSGQQGRTRFGRFINTNRPNTAV